MASRMERYYKRNNSFNKRIDKNQTLYRDIYDSVSYSNIEGIATIEKNNEIDITKVKKMLRNREDYKRQKEVSQLIKDKPLEVKKVSKSNFDNDRNYDIRDILDKAKINKKPTDKYHSLDNTNYDILKRISEKKELFEDKKEESELKELINTITNNSMLNKLADNELSLDLLDDLKSDGETIASKDAIRNILEDAKNEEKRQEDTTSNFDNSFFTSSLSFGEDDFEKMSNINNSLKKNTFWLKLLIFIFLVLITAGIIFSVYHFIK